MEPRHPFFREKAIQEYLQKQEKDFFPRFIPPYVFALFVLLVLLLLLIGVLIWWGMGLVPALH